MPHVLTLNIHIYAICVSFAIQCADTRFNNPDEDFGFMMFNTHSSYLMVQVMQKLFLVALKEVNKCAKASTPTPGFAEKAFAQCFAATFASDHVDHWRHDTEDPESVFRFAKKIEKLWRDLLCFTDAELGLVDPHTRKALLQKLDSLGKSWKEDAVDWAPKSFKGINVKTAKNGQGMGRPDPSAASSASSASGAATSTSTLSPSPAKKAKKAATISPDASSTSSPKILKLLAALDDAKLKMRAKTTLQIKIASEEEPSKSVVAVLSGATHMKKLNQICSYLTANDGSFHYHSQKGKCLKGSKIELTYQGEKVWLCDKPTGKKASSTGASFVEDKGIKIVQLFQGLNVNNDDGIFFDNEEAKDFALTEGAVAWVAPNGKRYTISIHCICATKSVMSGELLPRVVSIEGSGKAGGWKDYIMNAKTSFGMDIASTNNYMKGDREGRPMMFLGAPSEDEIDARAAINAARPISDENGASICCVGEDRNEKLFLLPPMFKKDLESAGLPENGGFRAADGASFVFEGEGMYGCKAVIKKN